MSIVPDGSIPVAPADGSLCLRVAPADLGLHADLVLRGEGMDPEAIRKRRPALAALAERVLAEELPALFPQAALRRVAVESFAHRRLQLIGGGALSGEAIATYLAPAQEVALLVCTVGPAIDARVAALMATDPGYAMAVDGLGIAAVEALGRAVLDGLKAEAALDGMRLTLPLSPGIAGWPLDEGQRQIFALLDTTAIGVTVAPSGRMTPRKTTSCVVGIGCAVDEQQLTPCDICSIRDRCRFRSAGHTV